MKIIRIDLYLSTSPDRNIDGMQVFLILDNLQDSGVGKPSTSDEDIATAQGSASPNNLALWPQMTRERVFVLWRSMRGS